MNELVKTAKEWQFRKTQLRPILVDGRKRARGEEIRREITSIVGWAAAAHDDHPVEDKCLLGYATRLTSSTLNGPSHIIHWTSKFRRKVVESTAGGQAHALREMADHMSLPREFYVPFVNLSRCIVGFANCENFSARRMQKTTTTKKHPVRPFSGIRRSLENR